MPKICTICSRPDRAQIDADPCTIRECMAKYGLSHGTIQRHRSQRHVLMSPKISHNGDAVPLGTKGIDLDTMYKLAWTGAPDDEIASKFSLTLADFYAAAIVTLKYENWPTFKTRILKDREQQKKVVGKESSEEAAGVDTAMTDDQFRERLRKLSKDELDEELKRLDAASQKAEDETKQAIEYRKSLIGVALEPSQAQFLVSPLVATSPEPTEKTTS